MNKRITPEQIDTLEKGDIFVFGSNEAGIHGAGAAHKAYQDFGARFGQGFGFQGRCFAIPTKDWNIKPLSMDIVKFYINRSLEAIKSVYSQYNKMFVTRIGCGLAGFKEEEIAPLFKDWIDIDKVYLPESFINIINSLK